MYVSFAAMCTTQKKEIQITVSLLVQLLRNCPQTGTARGAVHRQKISLKKASEGFRLSTSH